MNTTYFYLTLTILVLFAIIIVFLSFRKTNTSENTKLSSSSTTISSSSSTSLTTPSDDSSTSLTIQPSTPLIIKQTCQDPIKNSSNSCIKNPDKLTLSQVGANINNGNGPWVTSSFNVQQPFLMNSIDLFAYSTSLPVISPVPIIILVNSKNKQTQLNNVKIFGSVMKINEDNKSIITATFSFDPVLLEQDRYSLIVNFQQPSSIVWSVEYRGGPLQIQINGNY